VQLIGGMLIMRLYGAIQKVEPQDDGTVRVHGIASSEVVDDQGEIVRADAMRAAMPDYMRFPALREMHQLSAAGTTLEAEVGDDGATRIVAHVVDPIAITKVKNQVYPQGHHRPGSQRNLARRSSGEPGSDFRLLESFCCFRCDSQPNRVASAGDGIACAYARAVQPSDSDLGLWDGGPSSSWQRRCR
jgi:hypothetical protein